MNAHERTTPEERNLPDRRRQKLRAAICSLYKGRRREPRRWEEKQQPFYTDHYDAKSLATIFLILSLSFLDAVHTLKLLAHGGTELNPFMALLLEVSINAFFIGKFLLTALGLLIALVHINFKVLRVIPMRLLLFGLLGFYGVLIGYEILLLSLL